MDAYLWTESCLFFSFVISIPMQGIMMLCKSTTYGIYHIRGRLWYRSFILVRHGYQSSIIFGYRQKSKRYPRFETFTYAIFLSAYWAVYLDNRVVEYRIVAVSAFFFWHPCKLTRSLAKSNSASTLEQRWQ